MTASPGELRERYWFSRVLFLRLLGLIYFVAFFSLSNQFAALIGRDGLLPAQPYLDAVRAGTGDTASAFETLPTIFWWNCSDAFLAFCAYAGVIAALLLLAGFANVPLLFLLWALYLSFVHIGQLFWGYGWESLLLETGFLAIFLVPVIDPRPFPRLSPPKPVIWLLRWLLFRVMFGAGLIKLRGDSCWRDLTCMMFHYETQPLPNPASWYLHHLPPAVHYVELLYNHFVELIAVWLLFAPRSLRHFGAACIGVFQIALIISGNLSWLNWLTLALCIPAFDDRALRRCIPRRLRSRVPAADSLPRGRRVAVYGLVVFVAFLSLGPIANMLSPNQAMNRSFDPLELVNTYGAFGSVGRVRHEVILEGTDGSTLDDSTEWREYQFKCKPGDVHRRPCIIAPYQYRIDWQIWFAAMGTYRDNPWLVHFIFKLLSGDQKALALLDGNPFVEGPPKFIRANLYEYEFTAPGDPSKNWWTRRLIGPFLPPLSADDPGLRSYSSAYGWER